MSGRLSSLKDKDLDAIAALFGLVRKAKLDPLDPDDYTVIVGRLADALRGVAAADEAKALRAALRTLDVDWASMKAAERDGVIAAAKEALKPPVDKILPKVDEVLETSAKSLIPDTRASAIQKFKLSINASLGVADQRTSDFLRRSTALFVTDEYGARQELLSDRAKAVVARGLDYGLGSSDIRDKLVAEIVPSLLGRSQSYWDVIATTFSGRARTMTEVIAFHDAAITAYKWSATLDERSCDICRFMDGRVFSVSSAISSVRQVQRMNDPQAIKDAQPWIRTGSDENGRFLYYTKGDRRFRVADIEDSAAGTRDTIGSYTNAMSTEKLEAAGLGAPPVHGRCRCDLIAETV